MVSRAERLAAFWASAFTPSTLPACARMVTQILALVDTSFATWGRQGTYNANKKLIQKAQSAVNSLKFSVDQGELGRVTMLEKEVDEAEASVGRARRRLFWIIGGSFAFLIVMNLGVFGALNSMGSSTSYWKEEAQCKATYHEPCDRLCRLGACIELCEAERTWACVIADELKALGPGGAKK